MLSRGGHTQHTARRLALVAAFVALSAMPVASQDEAQPDPPVLEEAEPQTETSPAESQDEEQDEAPETQQPSPPTAQAILEPVDPIAVDEKSQQGDSEADSELREMARRDVAAQESMAESNENMVFIGWAGVVVTVMGVLLIWRTLVHTRIAAVAAREANRLQREAMIASQRAWMVTSLEIDGDFHIGQDEGAISVAMKHENIGKSPALYVHTNMAMILDYYVLAEELTKLCAANNKRDVHASRIVLPGEKYTRRWGLTVDEIHSASRDGYITPFVIGCITYEVMDDGRIHQTAFVYMLSGPFQPVVNRGTGSVPKGELTVEVERGGFAN